MQAASLVTNKYFVDINLNKVYNSWRLNYPLTLEEVTMIEQSCSEMMHLYGYEKVSGNNEKFQNMNIEFVDSSHSINLLN